MLEEINQHIVTKQSSAVWYNSMYEMEYKMKLKNEKKVSCQFVCKNK